MLIQGQRLAIICFVRSFCRFINSFALSEESYGSMSSCLKDIITCIIHHLYFQRLILIYGHLFFAIYSLVLLSEHFM